MLPNIFRKFSERHFLLRRYFDKTKCSTFRNNNFTHCRCLSSKSIKTENHPLNSLSKNTQRFCTNIATAARDENFSESEPVELKNTEITNEEIEKLLNLNWTEVTTEEFINNFGNLYLYAKKVNDLQNINVDNLLQGISLLSSKFSINEIIFIFKHTSALRNESENFFQLKQRILASFNDELIKRLREINVTDLQFLCQSYRHVGLAKKCFFVKKAIFRMDHKLNKLTPLEISKFMQLIAYCSGIPLNFYNIEYAIEQKLDTLEKSHFFYVLYGFLRNEYIIRNKSMREYICQFILKNINEIESGHINTVFLYLSLLFKKANNFDDIIERILTAIQPRLSELSLKNLSSILNLTATVAIRDEVLITYILERFSNEMHNLTLPDIERISCNLSVFNYGNYPFYKNVVDELNNPNRQQEISEHTRAFIRILQSLVYVNIYPENLISKIMDQEYIDEKYKSPYAMIGCHYFIYNSLLIERPNYSGHMLSEKLQTHFSKKFKSHELRESSVYKSTQEILKICERILKKPAYFTKIMPHYYVEDIVLCFDENDNYISPEQFLSQYPKGMVKRIPEEAKNYKWLSLIETNSYQLSKDSEECSGILAVRCRQLSILGYKPVVLSHREWYLHEEDDEQCEKYQENYLRKLLNVK